MGSTYLHAIHFYDFFHKDKKKTTRKIKSIIKLQIITIH